MKKTIENAILFVLSTRLFNWIPDDKYLKIKYRIKTKDKLNLENPGNYNEKIQWIKMNFRKDEHINMVDKYEARKFIEEKLGSKYLIPLIGIWDKTSDIDFAKLPDSFVLKCTHDSGSFIICRDKSKLNIAKTKRKLNRNLKRNYYYKSREWLYKDIKPRIICEQLLKNEDGSEIKDYKAFGFNGVVKFIGVRYSHEGQMTAQMFDTDWNSLDRPDMLLPGDTRIDKPQTLDEIINITRILSAEMPMLRVDLYTIRDRVYFGEMTFYHGSGFDTIHLEDLEAKMGDWIELPA